MCADVNKIKAGAAFIELSLNRNKLTKGLVAAQQQLRSFGQTLKGVGSDLLALGFSAGAPFYKSIRVFSDFTDKIKTLQAISGSDSTAMKRLEKLIRELGATTAFTAAQVADCAVELARMGFSSNEIPKGLRSMLNLVRATGEPVYTLGQNATYAAEALKIFNLPVEKTADVCDVLAYASNASSVGLADLGESLKIAGPTANALGEDIRDVAASLMVLSNAGIKGSLAGTSLRKVYQSLSEQAGSGKAGAEVLRNLGVEVRDLKTGNLRKTADIMADLFEKLRNMPNPDVVNKVVEAFDLRGALGALTLSDKAFDLDKFRQGLDDVKGYAEKTAAEIENSFAGQMRRWLAQIESIAISIGDAFKEFITPYQGGITLALDLIKAFIDSHKKLFGAIAGVAGIALALGTVFIALGSAVKLATFALIGIVSSFKITTLAMKAFTISYTALVAVLKITVLSFKALALALVSLKAVMATLKSAMVSLKAALGSLKAAMATLKAAMVSLKAAMVSLGAAKTIAFIGGITAGIVGIWYACRSVNSTFSEMKGYISTVGGTFKRSFDEIKKTAREAGTIIYQSLISGDYIGAFKLTWAAIKYMWQNGITGLIEIWEDFKLFFIDSWTVANNTLSKVFLEAWYGILITFQKVCNTMAKKWPRLWTSLLNTFDFAITSMQQQFVALKASFEGKNPFKELNKLWREFVQRRKQRNKEAANPTQYDVGRTVAERNSARRQADAELDEQLKRNRAGRDANMREHSARVNAAKREYEDAKRFAALYPRMKRVLDLLTELQSNAATEYQNRHQDEYRRMKKHYDNQWDSMEPSAERDKLLNAVIDALRGQKAEQDERIATARENAQKDRIITDDEQDIILDEIIKSGKLDSAIQYLTAKLRANNTVNPVDAMQTARGTGAWSFSDLFSQMGYSAQERTARATEAALPWLQKINRNVNYNRNQNEIAYN